MWYQKLESLDELILSGFQKVTEQAHRKLGWTKYDLAHLCYTGMAIATTAGGTYASLAGTFGNSSLLAGLGVIMAGLGYGTYKVSEKQMPEKEKKELHYLIEHNAPRPSEPDLVRPLQIGVVAIIGLQTMAMLVYGVWWKTPERLNSINRDEYELLSKLFSSALAGYWGTALAASYFRDTTMFPPQKERNILPRIKNFVAGKRAVEVPELSKVSTNI